MATDNQEKWTSSDQNAANDLLTTATWLLVAFFLGWFALVLRIGLQGMAGHLGLSSFRDGVYANLAYQTGTAFIWTLAWLTSGFLFGFIFGIPKVITATTSASNPALSDPSHIPSPKLKVNTNLEDISDWLTKVLVGASLTQIVKIPGAIKGAAEFMSSNDVTRPVSFNAALLVYYTSLGFLAGYILTRMFFARAFSLADQGPSLSTEAEKALDSASVGFGLNSPMSTRDPSLRKAALASDAVAITDSMSGDQALRVAKGATLTGDPTRALTASKLAVQKSPDDPEAQLTYAWSLRKLGASFDTILPIVQAASEKLSSSSDPSVLSSVYASLAYIWLYQPPPTGFEGAIRALDEYDKKNGRLDVDIEINRACAFGQRYSYLKNHRTDSESSIEGDLISTRNSALESVKKALTLDPRSASRLKELFWVTANSEDNDLSSFQGDAEFASLLPRP